MRSRPPDQPHLEGRIRRDARLSAPTVAPRLARGRPASCRRRQPTGFVRHAAVVTLQALLLPLALARARRQRVPRGRPCSTSRAAAVQDAVRAADLARPALRPQHRPARARPTGRDRARAGRAHRLGLRARVRRAQGADGLARPVAQGLGRSDREAAAERRRRARRERAVHRVRGGRAWQAWGGRARRQRRERRRRRALGPRW